GATETPFAGRAPFTSGNTRYFKAVSVSNGSVMGTFGAGQVAILNGLTIVKPLPAPFVKSALPTGTTVRDSAAIVIELLDYVTAVDRPSIKRRSTGKPGTPTIDGVAASGLPTVSYDPPGSLPESSNPVKIFSSNAATPPISQTNEFSFVVISEAKAALTV